MWASYFDTENTLERPCQHALENITWNTNQNPSQIIASPMDDVLNIDIYFTAFLCDVFFPFPKSLKSLDNKAYYFLFLWNMKT